jgi:hypothetical protein
MALLEHSTQVFIVRIWAETREIQAAPSVWRGVIEHVHSGERRYFRDVSEVAAFVGSFLEDLEAGSDGEDG